MNAKESAREPLIRVCHLQKAYPNVTPLKDVSADIFPGEVISVIGPSGTGKSTFLCCLNRMEEPTAGEIFVNGEDTTAKKYDLNLLRRKMGMVFCYCRRGEHGEIKSAERAVRIYLWL